MFDRIQHVVSMSGGKDSTATALVCLATQNKKDISMLFADTGNEHAMTYDYIDYLEETLEVPIHRVKADFSVALKRKADNLPETWGKQGVDDATIARGVELLGSPSGNAFLDLCMLKGRFPSSRARFCTTELKVHPIVTWQLEQIEQNQSWLWSWQGIRHDESVARRYLPESDDRGGGILNYRPILRWTVADVFEAMRYADVKPNPLYSLGMGRVGCMPCIFQNKKGISEIARRFPEVIERLREWERLVGGCNKSGYSAFFTPRTHNTKHTPKEFYDKANIIATVDWSFTKHGGKEYDLELFEEPEACSSVHAVGLCE